MSRAYIMAGERQIKPGKGSVLEHAFGLDELS